MPLYANKARDIWASNAALGTRIVSTSWHPPTQNNRWSKWCGDDRNL